MMDFSKEISLLHSLGFEQYDSDKPGHWEPDISTGEGELLFIYPDWSRQSMYIKLYDSHNEGEVGFEVYILDNIGCGATLLPFSWCELSEDWLTHLKMSFEGHGFRQKIT